MNLDSNAHHSPRAPFSASAGVALLLILVLAAALRLPHLSGGSYELDECWTAEVATGRGSAHQYLPTDVPQPQPDFYTLVDAPPWYAVWTHMEVTHPPLFYVLLRVWMNVLGPGDGVERLLPVLLSLAAIALLFDAARLHNGLAVAVWAALLMAVAQPMVEHARLTRNYAIELATTCFAVDLVVRIERFGITRLRGVALTLAVLLNPLSHYFSIGLLGMLGLYGLLRLRGRARTTLVLAYAAGGGLFLLCWGPFMWQQRTLFNVHDPGVVFLLEKQQGHLLRTIYRVLRVPADMLFTSPGPRSWLSLVGAVFYALPFLLLRRRPSLLLWAMLFPATVLLLLPMDVARHTRHLALIRYTLLCGPPLYVLIPALAQACRPRWLAHALPAGAVALCLLRLAHGPGASLIDMHNVVADLQPHLGEDPLLLFIGVGDDAWTANASDLMLSRYLNPCPGKIAFTTGPLSPATAARAAASQHVLAFTYVESGDHLLPPELLPGRQISWSRNYPGRFRVWDMTLSTPTPATPTP